MCICSLVKFVFKSFACFFLHKVVATGLLSQLPIPPSTSVALCPSAPPLGALSPDTPHPFSNLGRASFLPSHWLVSPPPPCAFKGSSSPGSYCLPTLQETCPPLLFESPNPIMPRPLKPPGAPKGSKDTLLPSPPYSSSPPVGKHSLQIY